MIRELIDIWDSINNDSFSISNEGRIYKKKDIDELISKLINNLNAAADMQDRLVFLDVRDRLTYIAAFFALLKMKAKVVLTPTEVNIEDYIQKDHIFISDNKEIDEGLFITENRLIKTGNNFVPQASAEHHDSSTVLYLYTSGSTGKAKLIQKNSVNLLSELEELTGLLKVESKDSFFFTPPLYHIYGLLFGLLLPVYNSCRLMIDYHFTPDTIADFVKNNDVTYFVSIPTYYRMFSDLKLHDSFKRCRALTNSSGPLPAEISKEFFDKDIKIVEVYGSTETGGIAHRIGAEDPVWKLFSYVKIIEGWADYLDEDNKKTASKQTELRIISPSVSVEYDHLTGFNTGDVVDLYPDNKFILLGRNTRFVKLSGKRVDLFYVSEKIKEYLKIDNIDVNDEDIYIGFEKGLLFALIDDKIAVNIKNLKNGLKKHMPSYAVPRIILNVKIPRNNMGKISKLKIKELISK